MPDKDGELRIMEWSPWIIPYDHWCMFRVRKLPHGPMTRSRAVKLMSNNPKLEPILDIRFIRRSIVPLALAEFSFGPREGYRLQVEVDTRPGMEAEEVYQTRWHELKGKL